MRDGVTIEDIAKRANVSKSTVSRVLNGTAVVFHQKQDAVHQAVIDLDYTPNMFAQDWRVEVNDPWHLDAEYW